MSLACLASGDVFVPVKIEEDDIFNGIKRLLTVLRPNWPAEHISFKLFTDGITNKLVACQLKENANENNIVLVRIYGHKTDLLIDRNAEIRNIRTLHTLDLAPEIYGIFENGLAYQYFPGVTLNTDTVLDAKIWPFVAQTLAKMHKVQLGKDVTREPMVWDKTEQFLHLLPQQFSDPMKHNRFVDCFGSVTKLRIEYESLKAHLTKTESVIVFAHNDLLLGNVIYNQDKGSISFIDYEYAAYNYQAYDIANHFNEFVGISIDEIDYSKYPNEEFQKNWIRVYLSEYLKTDNVEDEEIEKIYKEVEQHSLASHFLWGVWSLIQYEHSSIDFDFLKYAEIRLNRYYELKNIVPKELKR